MILKDGDVCIENYGAKKKKVKEKQRKQSDICYSDP